MDGNRYPELLIAGDFGTSRYYINNRDGWVDIFHTNGWPGWDIITGHNGSRRRVADRAAAGRTSSPPPKPQELRSPRW